MNTGRKLFFLKPLRWLHDQVFTFFRSLATFIKCKGNVWANSVFLLLLFPIEHNLQSSLHEKEEKCYAHDYPVFSTFSHLHINCQLVEILLWNYRAITLELCALEREVNLPLPEKKANVVSAKLKLYIQVIYEGKRFRSDTAYRGWEVVVNNYFGATGMPCLLLSFICSANWANSVGVLCTKVKCNVHWSEEGPV